MADSTHLGWQHLADSTLANSYPVDSIWLWHLADGSHTLELTRAAPTPDPSLLSGSVRYNYFNAAAKSELQRACKRDDGDDVKLL